MRNDDLQTNKRQTPAGQQQIKLLRVKSPEGECITVTGDRFVLGKSRRADYAIAGNPAVSRIHAVIYRKGSDWFLEDQGSLNHTYVEGKRIEGPCRLRDGLRIRLANEDFLLTMKDIKEGENAPLKEQGPERVCPSCGAELEEDDRFCSECGCRLVHTP